MIKKLGLTTVALSALLLSGCGGGGSKSTTEKMKEKSVIIITHNYPDLACTSQLLKDELTKIGAKDIITSIEDNTVSCQTYGRTNNSDSCGENVFGGHPNACVVGMNAQNGFLFDAEIIMAITPNTLLEIL